MDLRRDGDATTAVIRSLMTLLNPATATKSPFVHTSPKMRLA
jgi:hypothetical protein